MNSFPEIPKQGAKNYFFFLLLIVAIFIITALIYRPQYLDFGFAVFGTFFLVFLINLFFTKTKFVYKKKKLSEEDRTLEFALIIIVGITGLLLSYNYFLPNEKQKEGLPKDFKEVTFTINGEPVTLKNGVAEAYTALGGTSKTIVRYFGNEVVHDIDGDGKEDIVFLITQDAGGSGTFFYAVGALKRSDGYIGSHAVYIGDRIAPQTTESGEGRMIIVNYADRAPGEPMTARPSIGESLYLLLDPETLEFGEVVQGFEGEER